MKLATWGGWTRTDDLRQYGMAKEGVVARQFMLGVVQTAEGIPIYHEVFDGNTAEVSTLKPTIEKIVQRFPIKRVIAIADRGLLSTDNLADLQAIRLPSGQPLEFILAVPGRRYSGENAQPGGILESEFPHLLSHAIAGCAIGSAMSGTSAGRGCGAGALGALGSLAYVYFSGNVSPTGVNPSIYQENRTNFVSMMTAMGAALLGQNATGINVAGKMPKNILPKPTSLDITQQQSGAN